MSEALQVKELKPLPIRQRELGAVACAGCPFAQLGCPKEGTGDCPPAQEVVRDRSAASLLEDDTVGAVWGTDGGYQVLPAKEARLQPVIIPVRQEAVPPKPLRPRPPKTPEVKKAPSPRKKGQSIGEFVAALLLPAQKAT